MTVTTASNLAGVPVARPGPGPAKQTNAGGDAFRDVLDGGSRPTSDAGKATESAGQTTDSPHGKTHHGRRQIDDAGEEREEPPLRDRLPLLVNLHHLSGGAQDGRPDAADDNAKARKANDTAATVVPMTADAVAKALEKDVAKGKAEDLSPVGQAPRQTPHAAVADPEAKTRPIKAQSVEATARSAALLQPDPAMANRRQSIAPGKALAEAAAGGTPATDGTADPITTESADATLPNTRPQRIRESLSGHKGGKNDGSQQSAGEHRHNDAPRTVTVTASQTFAAPASHPMSQASATLVAAIGSDNGFRQAAAMQPAATPVAVATHVLQIELRPADLGSVTASLRMTGQQLSVELRPQTHEAYRRLEADKDDIVKALKHLGLGVDSVTVLQPQMASAPATRIDAASSATAAPNRDPASFQPGNPNGSGGGPAGQQPGRQPERNSNNGRPDGARGAQASRIGTGGNLFI